MPIVEVLKFLLWSISTPFGAASAVVGAVISFAWSVLIHHRGPAGAAFWIVTFAFNIPAFVLLMRLTANPNTEFLLALWPVLLLIPFGVGWMAGGLFGLISRVAANRIAGSLT